MSGEQRTTTTLINTPSPTHHQHPTMTSRMEQVFYATHSKVSRYILRRTSHHFRSTLEHGVLGLAVCGFCVVLLSHRTFVHREDVAGSTGGGDGSSCGVNEVDGESDSISSGGVSVYSILIQLVQSGYAWFVTYTSLSITANNSNRTLSSWSAKQIPVSCFKSIPGFRGDADVSHILLQQENEAAPNNFDSNSTDAVGSRAFTIHRGRDGELIVTGLLSPDDAPLQSCVRDSSHATMKQSDRSCFFGCAKEHGTPACSVELIAFLAHHGYIETEAGTPPIQQQPPIIYSYSHSKGLLLLDPTLLHTHNISTQFILASRHDVNCFGDPFVQNIVFSLVGADTVMLNWILGLQHHQRQSHGKQQPNAKRNADGGKRNRFVYHWKSGKELDLDLFHMDHYAFSSSSGSTSIADGRQQPMASSPLSNLLFNNLHKHPLYRLLRFLAFKFAVLLSTLFIFFLTTSLVSFTFQETQVRDCLALALQCTLICSYPTTSKHHTNRIECSSSHCSYKHGLG